MSGFPQGVAFFCFCKEVGRVFLQERSCVENTKRANATLCHCRVGRWLSLRIGGACRISALHHLFNVSFRKHVVA